MICNYSRPENFDDMMELNLSISEKLIRKNKFKSGYIVLSLFKNIIEFNEGTKNSHLYYEEDVNFDKKTQLLKMGKVIFEFVNFVNYLKKENKKAKIEKGRNLIKSNNGGKNEKKKYFFIDNIIVCIIRL